MKVVLQRVLSASVEVNNKRIGQCGNGFCIFSAIASTDTITDIEWMAQKITNLRVFTDPQGKMNLSILDTNGSVLIISQFTLLANHQTGRRPSFKNTKNPKQASILFNHFITAIKKYKIPVQTGIFGAEMLVHIENDGPATFILESPSHGTKK